MKVKKSSWHYKVYKKVNNSDPKDLCSYFWKVIGSLFLHFIFYSIVTLAILLYPVVFLVLFLFGSIQPFSLKNSLVRYKPITFFGGKICFYPATLISPLIFLFPLFQVFPGTAIALILLLMINAISYFIAFDYLISNGLYEEKYEEEEKSKEENIFLAYLKAKKRKVCPLIELED